MKQITVMLISVVCFSCNFSDVTEDLPGGWVYASEGKGYEEIYSNRRKHPNLIFSSVYKYSFNDDYILALQRPNYEIAKIIIASDLRITQMRVDTSKEIYEKSLRMADSVLENDEYYKRIFSSTSNYWIIDIKQDTVYGPLKKKEYLRIKKKKNIPLEL